MAEKRAFGYQLMTIIIPKLIRLHSPDLIDIEKPNIDESQPYCVLIQAFFGAAGINGEESFDILVCNSLWLLKEIQKGPINGRHHLFIDKFDIKKIKLFFENVANHSSGLTWDEVGSKIGRFARWEFEDYNDSIV